VNSGGIIVSLDEEGGVFDENKFISTLSYRLSIETSKIVTAFFFWGQRQASLFSKYRPLVPGDKIYITGHPKYEYLKHNFQDYFLNDVNKIQKKYGKIILINTNFTAANPVRGWWGYFLGGASVNSSIRTFVHQVYMYIILQFFIYAIINISKTFQNASIIIRPHPGENLDKYEKAFRGIENIYTVKEGNVHKWIHASDVVLHHDCSTGIEAVFAGKPVISYTPIKPAKSTQKYAIELSVRVSSLKFLLIRIGECLKTDVKTSVKRKIVDEKNLKLKDWVANTDFYSPSRIINVIKAKEDEIITLSCNRRGNAVKYINLLEDNKKDGLIKKLLDHFLDLNKLKTYSRKKILGYLSRYYFNGVGKKREIKYEAEKLTNLPYTTIEAKLKDLSRLDSKYRELRIKELETNGFLIYK